MESEPGLVGSPATICRRIDQLAALGFNYFMVSSATPERRSSFANA